MTAGFEVQRQSGYGGKRDMTTARFAPSFLPRRPPGRSPCDVGPLKRVMVVGAGLAGASAADALSRMGWHCQVLDPYPEPAQEASGNPGALFHGTWLPDDGMHARLLRACSLLAAQRYARLLASHGLDGAVCGVLQVDESGASLDDPHEYVRTVGATEAQTLTGLRGVAAQISVGECTP